MTTLAAAALVLHLVGPIDAPDPQAIALARNVGLGQAFVRVANTPGAWYSVALEGDTARLWPAGVTVMVAADGDTITAVEAFAVGPPLRGEATRLGAGAVWLEPDRLWRRVYRRRGICSVLFVRFPEHPGAHVAGVWAGTPRAAPATPGPGRGSP